MKYIFLALVLVSVSSSCAMQSRDRQVPQKLDDIKEEPASEKLPQSRFVPLEAIAVAGQVAEQAVDATEACGISEEQRAVWKKRVATVATATGVAFGIAGFVLGVQSNKGC